MATGAIKIVTPKISETHFDAVLNTKNSTATSWSNWSSQNVINFAPNGNTRNVKVMYDPTMYPHFNLTIVTPFFDYCRFFRLTSGISGSSYDAIVQDLEANAIEITYNDLSNCISNLTENVADDYISERVKTQFDLTPVSASYDYAILLPKYPVVEVVAETFTFTQNLSNCSSNVERESFESGETVNVTVTPESGYYFAESPTLSNGVIMQESGGSYSASFVITENVTLTAAAVVAPVKYTFTQNLSNCSSNVKETEFFENDTVNVTISPNGGYIIANAPTLSNGVEMQENGGSYSASFVITENVTLTAAAVKGGKLNKNVSNCVVEIFDKDGNNITNETTWNETQTPLTFTAVANNGFYFENIPRVVYFNNLLQQETQYLTLDSETGKYTATITPKAQYVNFTANAAVITAVYNKYGLITVYVPTLDELKEIAKARYFFETDEHGTRYYNDLGKFISKLHVMPLLFSGLRSQRLYLGNYPITESVFPVIDDNTVIVNMGNVEINGRNKNVVDYTATIKIYLPFIGFRNLETESVMDSTINVKYKIDVISGNAKAFISTVENDIETVIETFDCVVGYKIPFVGLGDIEKTFELNANYLWGLKAFILIDTPKTTGDNSTFGNADNKSGLIGSFNGLTEFEKVTLITNATETERNEIAILLERGVIL